jgi:hypothetical protein
MFPLLEPEVSNESRNQDKLLLNISRSQIQAVMIKLV